MHAVYVGMELKQMAAISECYSGLLHDDVVPT